MNEDDIKKQLQEKNKEIYLNKLNLDVANNLEVLVLSIDNLLNNIQQNAIKRVLGIIESFKEEDTIKKEIQEFINKYQSNLTTLINDKKVNLEQLIIKNKDLNTYKEYLVESNTKLQNQIHDYYQKNIDTLKTKLLTLSNDNFTKIRIEEYLKVTLCHTLNEKIMDTIKNRDIILLNTFKESYLKYLELNKNTIGEK